MGVSALTRLEHYTPTLSSLFSAYETELSTITAYLLGSVEFASALSTINWFTTCARYGTYNSFM